MLNSNFFPKSKLGSKKSSKNRNSNSVCPIGVLSIGLLRGVNTTDYLKVRVKQPFKF